MRRIRRLFALWIALTVGATQLAAAADVCLESVSPDHRVGMIAAHCDDDGPALTALCGTEELSAEPLSTAQADIPRIAWPTPPALALAGPGPMAGPSASAWQLPPAAARILPFSIVFQNFRS